MVIPYITNRTVTRYFQELIDSYSFHPDVLDWVPNDLDAPTYQNYLDYKVIESFEKHQPEEYVIYHASDTYLMPDDLENMIHELYSNDEVFANGIYPITNYDDTRMNERPVIPARVGVWKADIFRKYLDEFDKLDKKSSQGLKVDELYRMGEMAVRDGWKCMVAKHARPQTMYGKEFKALSVVR